MAGLAHTGGRRLCCGHAGAGGVGAAAAVCRPARRRPCRELPGRHDGRGQRGRRRRRCVAPAHRQPPARGQQFQPVGRRPPGAAAAVAAPGAAARAVAGPGHRHDRGSGRRRPAVAGRRGRTAARGDRRIGPLHPAVRRWRGQPAAALDRCRRPPLRAGRRAALRPGRVGQLPPGPQWLGCALHGGAFPRRAGSAGRRRPVLPMAAAAPAGLAHLAQHRARVRHRLSRRHGDVGDPQPGHPGAGPGGAPGRWAFRPGPGAGPLAQRSAAHASRRIRPG